MNKKSQIVDQLKRGIQDSFDESKNITVFSETSDDGQKSWYVEGTFVKVGGTSRNKRKYTEEFVEDAIKQIKDDNMKVVMWSSHYPHDENLATAARIKDSWIEDGLGKFRAKVLNTTAGKDMLELIKEGIIDAVSMRYYPKKYEVPNKEKDFYTLYSSEFKGIDFVDEPGVPEAAITSVGVEEATEGLDENTVKAVFEVLGYEDTSLESATKEGENMAKSEEKDKKVLNSEKTNPDESISEASAGETSSETNTGTTNPASTTSNDNSTTVKPQEEEENDENSTGVSQGEEYYKIQLEIAMDKIQELKKETKKINKEKEQLEKKFNDYKTEINKYLESQVASKKEEALNKMESFKKSDTLMKSVKKEIENTKFDFNGEKNVVDTIKAFEEQLNEIVSKYKALFEEVKKVVVGNDDDNKEKDAEGKEEDSDTESNKEEKLPKGGTASTNIKLEYYEGLIAEALKEHGIIRGEE